MSQTTSKPSHPHNIGQFKLPRYPRASISTFVSDEGLFHLPLSSKGKDQPHKISNIPKVPKRSVSNCTLIISAHNKIIGLPLHCFVNHWPKNNLSRINLVILKELQELPENTRLNVFVSEFLVEPNSGVEGHKAQISEICSLVACKGNGGLFKFSRLLPLPQLRQKIPT